MIIIGFRNEFSGLFLKNDKF